MRKNFEIPKKTTKIVNIAGKTTTEMSNKYDPLADPMSQQENDERTPGTSGRGATSQHNNAEKLKTNLPSIYVRNMKIEDTIELLTNNKIGKNNFTIKQVEEKYVSIRAKDMENYNLTLQILKEKKILFYTYTPKTNKPKIIIQKGVRGGYDGDDIYNEILEHKLQDIVLVKISKMRFDKANKNKYHFIIQISKESIMDSLTKMKVLYNQVVKRKKLRNTKYSSAKNINDWDMRAPIATWNIDA